MPVKLSFIRTLVPGFFVLFSFISTMTGLLYSISSPVLSGNFRPAAVFAPPAQTDRSLLIPLFPAYL